MAHSKLTSRSSSNKLLDICGRPLFTVIPGGVAAFCNFLGIIIASVASKAGAGLDTNIKEVKGVDGLGVGAVAFILALVALGANVYSHLIGSNNWRAALCRSGAPLQSIAVSNPLTHPQA